MPVVGDGAERHWGDPERSQNRQVFVRGEVPMALTWLTVGALMGLLLEIIYLGAWVQIGSVAVPVPWTIVVAYLLNLIITNTALLWTERSILAAVPVMAWAVGYLGVLLWQGLPFGGDQAMAPGLRMVLLLAAGLAGGSWPLFRKAAEA
ncbi:hypothetical protein [Corynebacterium sp. 335C]